MEGLHRSDASGESSLVLYVIACLDVGKCRAGAWPFSLRKQGEEEEEEEEEEGAKITTQRK